MNLFTLFTPSVTFHKTYKGFLHGLFTQTGTHSSQSQSSKKQNRYQHNTSTDPVTSSLIRPSKIWLNASVVTRIPQPQVHKSQMLQHLLHMFHARWEQKGKGGPHLQSPSTCIVFTNCLLLLACIISPFNTCLTLLPVLLLPHLPVKAASKAAKQSGSSTLSQLKVAVCMVNIAEA